MFGPMGRCCFFGCCFFYRPLRPPCCVVGGFCCWGFFSFSLEFSSFGLFPLLSPPCFKSGAGKALGGQIAPVLSVAKCPCALPSLSSPLLSSLLLSVTTRCRVLVVVYTCFIARDPPKPAKHNARAFPLLLSLHPPFVATPSLPPAASNPACGPKKHRHDLAKNI